MSATSHSARARLQVEALEQRSLPSTVSYVSSLYTNLLKRTASVQEEVGWIAQINLGMPPAQVTNAFVTSPEYRSNLIENDYQVFLRRTPQPAEVQGWLNQLENGLGEQALESAFLGSAEFFALHGNTKDGWVNAVYPAVLGRNPSAGDLAVWTGHLQSGLSLQAVALDIVMSPESEARQVSAAYVQLLRRNPDAGGLEAWTGQLEHGLSPAQLKSQFTASPEYISLQGGLDLKLPPPPSNPTPIDDTPNAPTGEVYPSTGFLDPGAFPTDTGSTDFIPDNTGYTSDITIPDPGTSIPDPGITSDPGYDPECDC